jgi:hypothetical protein
MLTLKYSARITILVFNIGETTQAPSTPPRFKIPKHNSRRHLGQFKGSLGSSDGCGARTICAFRPVPCLRPAVRSVCAASSSKMTVPGTCGSLRSKTLTDRSPEPVLPSRTPNPMFITAAQRNGEIPDLFRRQRCLAGKEVLGFGMHCSL